MGFVLGNVCKCKLLTDHSFLQLGLIKVDTKGVHWSRNQIIRTCISEAQKRILLLRQSCRTADVKKCIITVRRISSFAAFAWFHNPHKVLEWDASISPLAAAVRISTSLVQFMQHGIEVFWIRDLITTWKLLGVRCGEARVIYLGYDNNNRIVLYNTHIYTDNIHVLTRWIRACWGTLNQAGGAFFRFAVALDMTSSA